MQMFALFLIFASYRLSQAVSIRKHRASIGLSERIAGTSPTIEDQSAIVPQISPATDPQLEGTTRKGRSSNDVEVEKQRRSKIAVFRREYDQLRAKLSGRDPWEYTQDERLEVSLLRMQLSGQISEYNRRSGSYLTELKAELQSMRKGLSKWGQYKDQATKAEERKASNVDRFRRWTTRRKAKVLGINIKVKMGKKPLKDNPPAPIRAMRNRNVQRWKSKKRRERMQDGEARSVFDAGAGSEAQDDLLRVGWTNKRQKT